VGARTLAPTQASPRKRGRPALDKAGRAKQKKRRAAQKKARREKARREGKKPK